MSEKWAWISGWGIQPERFQAAVERALPDASHAVFAPTPDAVEAVVSIGASHLGGYSLGSLLLMNALSRVESTSKIYCLAPIPAFCKEAEFGGSTPRAILKSLQAKLERKPEAALKLFYRLAGLDDEPSDNLPYSLESLTWGLEMLSAMVAPKDAFGRVHAVISYSDTLMDANTLQALFPRHSTTEKGHDYHHLLPLVATAQ